MQTHYGVLMVEGGVTYTFPSEHITCGSELKSERERLKFADSKQTMSALVSSDVTSDWVAG